MHWSYCSLMLSHQYVCQTPAFCHRRIKVKYRSDTNLIKDTSWPCDACYEMLRKIYHDGSILHAVLYAAFNSLLPGYATWQHKSWSTLAQAITYWLMALSHYRNQCWLIISEIQWHSQQGNLKKKCSRLVYFIWIWKPPILCYSHIFLVLVS